MAPTNERRLHLICLPSLATLLWLTFLIILKLPSVTLCVQHEISSLCAPNTDPASCITNVSQTTLIAEKPQTNSMQFLATILNKSLDQINVANAMATYTYHQNNETQQRVALTDCMHLMDLSYDHVTNSASAINKGSWIDAQTWMSAVFTSHKTCLDRLKGPAKSSMEYILKGLMALTTTSLSMLKTISPSNDFIEKPVVNFPSWLPYHDKKLLEYPFGNEIQPNVVVAADGSGNYTTVQQAVDSAPVYSMQRYVIHVKTGVYKEIVRIDANKTNLMIIGDGFDSTILTGSLASVADISPFFSATLSSEGPGLIVQDLKLENTAGPEGGRGMALRAAGDRSVFYRCRIDGHQDTLYAHMNRQFYRDCWISGTIDFIFGDAAVVFQNCSIFAHRHQGGANMITAQSRSNPLQNSGTSFQNCNVLPDDDLKPVIQSLPTYLGRPWGMYARVVYMQSFLDQHINPQGWESWRAKPDTLYYGEYQNWGPGADTSHRVKWPGYHVITNSSEVEAFTVARLIQGETWLNGTRVPYNTWL